MIRKHKKYKRPRKLYDKMRILEENELTKKYGLKNKREIWKAKAFIDKIRRRAKKLITSLPENQEKFFEKLNKMGFKVEKIADILGLTTEDWLRRRLQSILVEKKIAKTAKQARQFIVHKNIAIGQSVINIPSYIVPVDEEKDIKFVGKPLKLKEKIEDKNGQGKN